MIKRKKLSTNVILFSFLVFFFIFNLFKFYNLPPRIDQSFHIYWLLKIISADFNLITNFNEIASKFSNKNSVIYELLRVIASSSSLFSYYFQPFFIIILSSVFYLFNFIFSNEPILFFNIFSILFGTLNVFISFKILQFLINDFKFIDIEKSNELIFIFILIFSSYYLFNFSPLGIHNFSSFFFLLTIYLFLRQRKNYNILNYLFLGILSTIAVLCHLSNLIFLVPTIVFFTLISFKSLKLKIKLIFYYLFPIIIILLPLVFLINLYSDQDVFPVGKKLNLFINFITYFKNWLYLIGPISCIVFINGFFKKNIENKNILFLYCLIFFHFLLFLILPILSETYYRNYLYITYLYLIIFSFFIITIDYKKKIIIFFLIANCAFNAFLIFNDKFFSKINNNFYNTYYSNNEFIQIFGNNIKNSEDSILIIPYDQNTVNYIYAYKPIKFNKGLLLTKKFYGHTTYNYSESLDYIKNQIQNHNSNFALISMVNKKDINKFDENFKFLEHSIIKSNLCKIKKSKIFKKELYYFNGNYELSIYEYSC